MDSNDVTVNDTAAHEAVADIDLSSAVNQEARRAIEAIVMVADEPADPRLIAQLVEVGPEVVDRICESLATEYDEARRGFELVRVAGGWRYQSTAEMAPYVERFVLTGQSSRLSAAALETLAIVAYKQPISRAQVASIRGVNVDGVMRTLHQRGYIAELARDPGPGQAVLFGTTSLFLSKLGLDRLDDLPALGDFVPGPDVLEALEVGLRVSDDVVLEGDLAVGDVEVSADRPAIDLSEPASSIDLTDERRASDAEQEHDHRVSEPLDALEILADDPTSNEDEPHRT